MAKNTKQFIYTSNDGNLFDLDEVFNSISTKSSNVIKDDKTLMNKNIVNKPYSNKFLLESVEKNTYHRAAVEQVAKDVSFHGFYLQGKDGEETNEERKKQAKKILNKLFKHGLQNTLYRSTVDLRTYAYNFLEISRNEDGTPLSVFHVVPTNIYFTKGRELALQKVGTDKVWFKQFQGDGQLNKNTGEVNNGVNNSTEFFSMLIYSPISPTYGLPPAETAKFSLMGELARVHFVLSFFRNRGVPAYVVTVTGNFNKGTIDEDGYSELENNLKDEIEGLIENPHSTSVITIPKGAGDGDAQVNIEKIGETEHDASFQNYRKDNRDEILAANGVSPYKLGIAEQGSLGGEQAEEANENYKNGVIIPIQNEYKNFIDNLLEELGYEDLEFVFESIDKKDEKKEFEMDIKKVEKGIISRNEFRNLYGHREINHPSMDGFFNDKENITGSLDGEDEQTLDVLTAFENALQNMDERDDE